MKFPYILLSTLLLLSSCDKYYVSVRNIPVDSSYLASSAIGSPDPRMKNPPFGQKLIISWDVPPEILQENPRIVLDVVYKNHTDEQVIYPVDCRRGDVTFDLLNPKFAEKQGFLCYRAEFLINDHTVYKEWKHQLWVELISLEEESASDAESSKDSDSSQPKQGSVTETPDLRDAPPQDLNV